MPALTSAGSTSPASTSRAFAARLVKQSAPDPGLADKARLEASRLLDGARAEAARILDGARAEAARIAREADGAARTAAEGAVAAHLLASRKALDAEMALVRPALAAILRDALGRLVGECCGDDVLARLLGRALDDLSADLGAEVALHPGDRTRVEPVLAARPGRPPRLVADPALSPGQARLRVAGMTVELGLDRQLALFETLLAGQ